MVHADYLFLLTDVDGLYSSNPRKDPDAKFLEVVSSVAEARLEGKELAKILLYIVPPTGTFCPSSRSLLFLLLLPFITPRIDKTQLTV